MKVDENIRCATCISDADASTFIHPVERPGLVIGDPLEAP